MTIASDRTMSNKVPLVTAAFCIIKILATTVGETGAPAEPSPSRRRNVKSFWIERQRNSKG